MNNKRLLAWQSKNGLKESLKSLYRRENERQRKAGFQRFVSMLRRKHKGEKTLFDPPRYERMRYYSKLGPKPQYGECINYLLSKYKEFSPFDFQEKEDGNLTVPEVFSLSENYADSMAFLKRLFHLLHTQACEKIFINYKDCLHLDVDASAVMDIILAGFIEYYHRCSKKNRYVNIQEIVPINFKDKEEIVDILFSIGAYANLRGVSIKRDNVIPFLLKTGDSKTDKKGVLKEIHETEIVDYVLQCLTTMGRTLTPEAEANLSKVVGEVMANAEEHSLFRYRYAIGYFKTNKDVANSLGVFKLVIFNFGQTIYESFKNPNCANVRVVQQMTDLSKHYSKKGWFGLFGKKKFEEQTLWTLYALQERVTSLNHWRRGSGSTRFIDRFFKLKGNCERDNTSKLTLISGNSRIIFDGTYPLVEREKNGQSYQIMAFNEKGDLHELPDDNFVTFADQFFPGTIISAKICLTYNNIETV